MKPGHIIERDGQKYLVQSAENVEIVTDENNLIQSIIVGVKYTTTPLSEEQLERIKQRSGGKLVYSVEHLYRRLHNELADSIRLLPRAF